MTTWQGLTPAQVLDSYPALTMTQVAFVLNLTHQRGAKQGEPDRRQALELVYHRKLRVIDSTQPVVRWTVSANTVRDYLVGSAA